MISFDVDAISRSAPSGGSIANWTATTSFPTPRYGHTSVAYNGYLYVIGGYGAAGSLNDVQFTTLQGPACRAAYSKLIDIGSDMLVQSVQFSNSAGKGITNLNYAVAPSATAVFGPRTTIPGVSPGLPYTTGLNICGQYVWVRFELDDTLSATIDGGGLNGRTDILDFTITYSPCCNAPSGLTNNTAVDVDSCVDTGVRISWAQDPTNWGDNNIGIRTYDVLRDGSAIASGLAYGTTSFVDTTGINGQTYTYTVRYNNGCSLSLSTAPGAQAADNYDIMPCPNIGNTLFVVKSGVNAVISWTAVACADLANYRVYGSISYNAPFPSGWTILGNPGSPTWNNPLSSSYIAYKTISINSCGNTSSN